MTNESQDKTSRLKEVPAGVPAPAGSVAITASLLDVHARWAMHLGDDTHGSFELRIVGDDIKFAVSMSASQALLSLKLTQKEQERIVKAIIRSGMGAVFQSIDECNDANSVAVPEGPVGRAPGGLPS